MKKSIRLFLSLLLICSMIACGRKEDKPAPSTPDGFSEIVSADTEEVHSERVDEPEKTGSSVTPAPATPAPAVFCKHEIPKADIVHNGIAETLTYMDFPTEHWMRIRTNNTLERLNREIKRRTKVVGTFPDGQSALMLVCARLRHVASHEWGSKRYLNMQHLHSMELSGENTNVG